MAAGNVFREEVWVRGSVRHLVAAAVVAAAVIPLTATAAMATHVQCGDTITQDTTLDGDLMCAGGGVTVAGDVTLDLAGHTIDVSDTGIAVFASEGRILVRDGTITESGTAIESDGPDALLVEDVLIEGNSVGVSCMFTPECSVLDSVLRYQGAVAIRMHAPDSGGAGAVINNQIDNNGTGISLEQYTAPITNNRIEENEGDGVKIDFTSQVQVSRNVVARNGGEGVVVSFLSDATIAHNAIEGNGANGIRVIGDFFFEITRATVRDNRISGNGDDGVRVENAEGAPGTVIERNHARHNADDGIDVDLGRNAPPEVDTVVRANKAYFNADLGIEAASGTTDGGSNKAKHNGNLAQCVGVRCK